jgi:UDP-2,4-diacetamido-2,4,6-trideoxy-beta-L-altropyranose hydrolase
MKVAIRADASVRIGIGHLMRCLTLAEALRERGAQLRFICREHEGNLITLLQQKAMVVTVLPAPAINTATTGEDYAAWLGASQAEDAEQTIEALNGWKPDWLVADHYGLDIEWETRLRPHVSGLMVIDDLANRHHDCDVLLDQNYSAEGERRYAGLVPATCKLLIGPRYALLRPEYAAYRKMLRARNGQVARVFVFFGGTDPQNMTGAALEALSVPDLKYLDVDVVLGANNPHRKRIEQQAAHRPRTTLYESRPHLADLMGQADLAVGAGGTTTLERLCLGLPSLVVSIAENQVPSCVALYHAHLINYLGYQDKMEAAGFQRGIEQMIDSPDRLVSMSQDGLALVDGLGVDIISDTLGHNA